MFDNGNNNHDTPYYSANSDLLSRLVEYEIDTNSGKFTLNWELSELTEGPLFAEQLSNADPLPVTGNVLGTWGDVRYEAWGDNVAAGYGESTVHVVEVAEGSQDIIWEIRLQSDGEAVPRSWTVDRALRLPWLYPPQITDVRVDL